MHTSKTRRRWFRAATVAAAFAATGALGGCSDFLAVENPGAIETEDLNDPKYIGLLVNGVIGEFQPMLPTVAYYSAVFTDELRNHHNFFEEKLIDQRNVTPDNATYVTLVYNPMHRTRFMADSAASYLRAFLADSAGRDLRLARVQAYGGYSYVLLGETLCGSPINVGPVLSSTELLTQAVTRFTDVLSITDAARALPTATAGQKATADSLANLARVGMARAYLQMGNKAKALEFALQVPAAYEFRSYYSINSARENNPIFGRLSQVGSLSGGLDFTPWATVNSDPRVPRPTATEATLDGIRANIPNSPLQYSTYNNTVVGAEFSREGWLRIASGLEAQYIAAEAAGPTAATIAFVESRRVIDPTGRAAAATTTANFMANLREQRARDFYLSGHRLGDLRRYKAQYGVDLFPSGPYENSTSGEVYGSLTNNQTCFPLSAAEISGNPNVPKT
jgi:hypothetical protein